MPQIPQLESQVQEQPLPSVTLSGQAPQAAFGGGVAQGLQSVGQAVEREVQRAQENANAVALTEAEAALNQWETERLYDAETGALHNTRGKEALALPDEVSSEYRSRVSEIRNTLANDQQRRAFDRVAASHFSSINRRVNNYAAEQFEEHDAAQTDAALASSLEIVANNTDNPDRIRTELERQERLIRSRGARTGAPEEVVQMKIDRMASDSHVAAIEQMLSSGQYEQARQYFSANETDISTDKRPQVQSAIREGGTRQRSQRKADEILSRHSDRGSALSAAREISDPEVRDATVRRVNSRFTEQEQVEEERLQGAIDRGVEIITQGGSVDDIPPQLWERIPREQRGELRALANEGEWYHDDETWYEITQMDQEELAEVNLMRYRPRLSRSHFDRATIMQQEAQQAFEGDAQASANLSSTLTFKDRLDNALVETDLFDKTTGLEGDDAARYAQVQTEAARQVELREREVGRKLTGTEIQEVIDGVITNRVFRSNFFADDQIPASAVLEDERGNIYVPMNEIPEDAAQRIQNLGRSYGNSSVSNDQIQRAYAAALAGDNELVNEILQE